MQNLCLTLEREVPGDLGVAVPWFPVRAPVCVHSSPPSKVAERVSAEMAVKTWFCLLPHAVFKSLGPW